MQSKCITANVLGIEGRLVIVETDISRGLPRVEIIGLGDQAIKEASVRVKSAIKAVSKEFPSSRVTVNLSPAYMRKKGTHFDLPIALGILASSGQVFDESFTNTAFLGELSLNGEIVKCKGVLNMVKTFKDNGVKRVIVPQGNMAEGCLIDGIEILGADNLLDVISFLNRNEDRLIREVKVNKRTMMPVDKDLDFLEVKGQEHAKRALIISAAGGHGILLTGSPGTGKTMLAERVPGILPKLEMDEIVELTSIYSAAGLLTKDNEIIDFRPFRNPGNGLTIASLLGGGISPRPGEVSLAHKGVLFTAESPFSPSSEIKEGSETAETRAFCASELLPFGKRRWEDYCLPEICETRWGEYVNRYVPKI